MKAITLLKSTIILVLLTSGYYPALLAQGPDTLWTARYGGSEFDNAFGIEQTADNGYVIIGSTKSYGAGDNDVYLIKVDESGTEEWTATFGGLLEDRAYSIKQTSDGGYIFCGKTWSFGAGLADVWVIRTDPSGNEIWSKTYGGSGYERADAMHLFPDESFAFIGKTSSYGAGIYDFYLVKADSDGNELWSKTYGGVSTDIGVSFKVTDDGGFILVGESQSYGAGNADVYIVRTDSSGNELWSNTFGDVDWDHGTDVIQTDDGGYLLAGRTWSLLAGQGYDAYVIKTDQNGNEEWIQQYPGTNSEYPYTILESWDGNYLIEGYNLAFPEMLYSYYMFKIDKDGNRLWLQNYGGDADDYSTYMTECNDGGYAMIGRTESFGASVSDIWLVKTKPETTGVNDNDLSFTAVLSQNHPNPFTDQTTIEYILPASAHVTLTVYNLFGQEITKLVDDYLPEGSHTANFLAKDLPRGNYLYILLIDQMPAGKGKMIIQ